VNVVAIVQTRLASTRLPAKILLDLGGRTALERCLARVRRGTPTGVVATSVHPEDDVIERAATRLGYPVFRGSHDDVLARYAGAARAHAADVVLRFTSDCPLLDPGVSARVLDAFLRERPDYASNVLTRRYPRGLDTEVFSRATLERLDAEARDADEREHVTLRVHRRPGEYRLLSAASDGPDLSHHRWTLDTLEDYRFLHAVHDQLGAEADDAPLERVLALLERRPDLVAINGHVSQKKV